MSLSSKKMNLDYIRTFTVLGQSRNMTEASRKLGVDTSYVSRHIKQLEKELQTKLVILSSKNKELKLTEAGQYFYKKYEKIYNEILLTEKNYYQMIDVNNFKISFGINSDLESYLLKTNLHEFTDKFPNINIKIKHNNFEELWSKLLQFSFDFIFCKLPTSQVFFNDDVIVHTLLQSNYCLVYNPKKYSFSKMEESSIILPTSNMDERTVLNQYFKDNNLVFKRSYEVESFAQMISYVKNGFGVGFALKETVENDSELKVIELNCPCTVILAYMKDNITPIVQEFINMFIEH